MSSGLLDQTVLIIGGAKPLGLAVARAAAAEGAKVVIGARDDALAAAEPAELPRARAMHIDLTDESSIAFAAAEIGHVDHVVITVSAHHNVPVVQIERNKAAAAFETKIIGPLLVAKHFAPLMPPDRLTRPVLGCGSVESLGGSNDHGRHQRRRLVPRPHLAVELAPLRVNAISPGIIDSGTWDALPETARDALFRTGVEGSLAGRAGTRDDIADAVIWMLCSTYLSGETIHLEGGARH
ncbi:SDR family oxidoreductase [Microbacterium sediminicola]|uniref:SDR family oxidoreductase n=1 Tax=Microbacterium sediminicola TaxID=415210 RepID=A0ABN2IJP3_9MICO